MPFTARAVWLPSGRQRFPLRVIRYALPPDQATVARHRIRKTARREATRFAAGFVIVVTNLSADAWSSEDVLDLYCYRWQIEV